MKFLKYSLSLMFILLLAACHDSSSSSESGDGQAPTSLIDHIEITAENPPQGYQSSGNQVAIGFQLQFKAVAYYKDHTIKDITDSAVWSSENTDIAEINDDAIALGKESGSTAITAIFDGVTSNRSLLQVTSANLIDIQISGRKKTLIDVPVDYIAIAFFDDQSQQDITKFVEWSSSNESVVNMVESTAVPASGGRTEISANYAPMGFRSNELELFVLSVDLLDPDNPYELTLSPSTSTIVQGTSELYTVKMNIHFREGSGVSPIPPFNITNYVQFSASDDSLVQLEHATDLNHENVVKVKGIKPGKVKITGFTTVMGKEVSREGQLTVTPATLKSITVSCDDNSVPEGLGAQCYAMAAFKHEDDIEVPDADVTLDSTWLSSEPKIATIDEKGQVTAIEIGDVNISASIGSMSSQLFEFHVDNYQLLTLNIINKEETLEAGEQLQMKAQSTTTSPNDEVVDVTNRVAWSIVDGEGATISSSGKLMADSDIQQSTTITVSANIEDRGQQLQDNYDIKLLPVVGVITDENFIVASGAIADGSDINEVTAIVTDKNGNPLANQKVEFKAQGGALVITTTKGTTDEYGKATAEVTSTLPGDYLLEAKVKAAVTSKTMTFVPDSSSDMIITIQEQYNGESCVAPGVNGGASVIVTNKQGEPLSGVDVIFEGPYITAGGDKQVTNTDGIAKLGPNTADWYWDQYNESSHNVPVSYVARVINNGSSVSGWFNICHN